MSFDIPEWGSAATFSYYGDMSRILENVQFKTKNSGKKGKKRLISEVSKDVLHNNTQKKKKDKDNKNTYSNNCKVACQEGKNDFDISNDKEKQDIVTKSNEGHSYNAVGGSVTNKSPSKMKQETAINGLKNTGDEQHVVEAHSKKVQKKNKNKYKELTIEQNKRKLEGLNPKVPHDMSSNGNIDSNKIPKVNISETSGILTTNSLSKNVEDFNKVEKKVENPERTTKTGCVDSEKCVKGKRKGKARKEDSEISVMEKWPKMSVGESSEGFNYVDNQIADDDAAAVRKPCHITEMKYRNESRKVKRPVDGKEQVTDESSAESKEDASKTGNVIYKKHKKDSEKKSETGQPKLEETVRERTFLEMASNDLKENPLNSKKKKKKKKKQIDEKNVKNVEDKEEIICKDSGEMDLSKESNALKENADSSKKKKKKKKQKDFKNVENGKDQDEIICKGNGERNLSEKSNALKENTDISKKKKKKKQKNTKNLEAEEEIVCEEDDDEDNDPNLQTDLDNLLTELDFGSFHKEQSKKIQGVKTKAEVKREKPTKIEKEISKQQDSVCKATVVRAGNILSIESEPEGPADKKKKKKNKLASIEMTDSQTPLQETPSKKCKFDTKKLTDLLQETDKVEKAQPVLSTAEALRQKMSARLDAARFRMVNEELYTRESSGALEVFKEDKESFQAYHDAYQSQVRQWPVKPLDEIISWLKNKPKNWVVADLGCGEARLAREVPQKTVHSLDLVAVNPRVIVCDMAHTPLQTSSVDVVVFCLSLMGTNIKDFISEANRLLKQGGVLKIAEVESRFTDVKQFVSLLGKYGFYCTRSNTTQKFFYIFDFQKYRNLKKTGVPDIILKPCIYKKR